MSTMAQAPNSQYHHFVPQFLLHNFSHPYAPPQIPGQKSKRPKRKYKKGMYPGDRVVRNVDLAANPPVICEKPVKRILGKMDMYRDTSQPTPNQQQHVEQMFSKLESSASIIFHKIVKSFEQRESGIWLTRGERNVIRKFLFILKYRGSTFHRRFYHESRDTYEADDREILNDYMEEKGYKRPIDVWFDNLKAIMELEMDAEKKWIFELPKMMFPMDAEWFIAHVEGTYMAICTPADADDEFVLTDNSFNVFEGPNSFVIDEETGNSEGVGYAPLHDFAPISPKLIIVLRSFLLSVPEEDAYAGMRSWREECRYKALGKVFQQPVKSVLEDLPISKAMNNYVGIVNGRLRYLDGEDGRTRKDHKFCFKFFPIETKHVLLINAIFFENAYTCTSVVFESETAFRQSLEWYLTEPCPFAKIISGEGDMPRLSCLNKLATVLRSLGSEKKPVWKVQAFPATPHYELFRRGKAARRQICNHFQKLDEQGSNPEFTKLMGKYKALGGSAQGLLYDMEQSGLMWKLRVKIDSWSQGVDEHIRARNRRLLIDAYLRLPPGRVWFFLKRLRFETLNLQARSLENMERKNGLPFQPDPVDGPEDVIARASHIIESDRLARLMYVTTWNDLKRPKQPETGTLSLWEYATHVTRVYKFTFETPGRIQDCGIPEIEKLAAKAQQAIIQDNSWDEDLILDNETIELMTRCMVRDEFVEVLSSKVEQPLLGELHEIFFDVAYPILDFEEE
ncbi:hypothetical protein EDB80DRAFT_698755 [Ilyonectria destructans]|nr:hypothetical protein EDB80DRAFT_698755 [Ilyonectria destructans]